MPSIQVQEQNGITLTRTIIEIPKTVYLTNQTKDVQNEYFFKNGSGQSQDDVSTDAGGGSTPLKVDERCELDISFWELNPNEHIWARLKSDQLYDKTNILLLVYNADDRESFEMLDPLITVFNENNKIGAYQILCSVITKDIIDRNVPKEIKKQEAEDFI